MPNFVLQIQDLDESGKDWNFAIDPDWLSSALEQTELRPTSSRGALQVHAQRSGTDVFVQSHVDASLLATCARCLDDVPMQVDLALSALYSPEQTRPAGQDEVEVRLDEMARDYYGGSEIILDPMIREHLLLEAPMKPLCAEDCEGIAVPSHVRPPDEVFGASAPDGRFAPLLKLKEELKNEEE
ncbi:MAG: DUF177 domain-containing protein [Polyangiales bacterium]